VLAFFTGAGREGTWDVIVTMNPGFFFFSYFYGVFQLPATVPFDTLSRTEAFRFDSLACSRLLPVTPSFRLFSEFACLFFFFFFFVFQNTSPFSSPFLRRVLFPARPSRPAEKLFSFAFRLILFFFFPCFF